MCATYEQKHKFYLYAAQASVASEVIFLAQEKSPITANHDRVYRKGYQLPSIMVSSTARVIIFLA